MKAVRYHETGPADVLKYEDAPRPEPREGEILVRVHSAGINPVDSAIRAGRFGQAELPGIPGIDLAGTVETVGPGVSGFQPGQAVFGTGRGTYAEYAIAMPGSLAPKPANMTFDEAATIGVGARTSWGGLFNAADLQAGQRLLIHAAAGGVGVYAVQLGKWKGAEVIGTASPANTAFVKELGADRVIDYTTTPFETAAEDVDVVFAGIGGVTIDRSYQVLKKGGILVSITGRPDEEVAKQHGVRVGRVGPTTAQPDVMLRVGELIAEGKLKAMIRSVFPLDQVRRAMESSETGHGRGHIVLHVRD